MPTFKITAPDGRTFKVTGPNKEGVGSLEGPTGSRTTTTGTN